MKALLIDAKLRKIGEVIGRLKILGVVENGDYFTYDVESFEVGEQVTWAKYNKDRLCFVRGRIKTFSKDNRYALVLRGNSFHKLPMAAINPI